VPDDPQATAEVLRAERVRRPRAAELGGGAGCVVASVLGDADVVDPLAAAQRDLAEAAAESARKRVREVLVDGERTVGLDADDDVGGGEREGLRGRDTRCGEKGGDRRSERERGRAWSQNATCGASRAGSSISK
jgi:hypothetical protein